MYISINNLKDIIKEYKKHLLKKRIIDISLVNSRLFLFTIKNEKKKLIIDLDNINPHIGMIETNFDELSLPSEFIAKAMNKGKPLIEDIEVINEDKIIKITTSATDAYYHVNKFYLYIELINAKANMILTDINNTIIVAFYETSLLSPRPIVKNIKYQILNNKKEYKDDKYISFSTYQEYVINFFNKSLEKRKKETYGPLIKKYQKKIKSLENKIQKINESVYTANKGDKYKEYGETLLMHIDEIKKGSNAYLDIKIDPSKSVSENANIYFNKYKKSKRTIETSSLILNTAYEELEENKYYLDVLTYGKEDEINEIIIKNISDKKRKEIKAYLPYYINYQNVRIYYGKNAMQNDYLTFKMFKKNSHVIFMHIKDIPSSHLIININNPNNEILDIAASMLLYINHLKSAEIMYTIRSKITRGNELGKVNFINFKYINLNKINPKIYELIKKEKRTNE